MKKKLLSVVLAATMVAGMTGCGSNPENKGSSGKGSESSDNIEPCTIKFQYWADNTDYSSLMQDIIKKFNDENEYDITVEGEETPWDGGGYSNTLFNAAMGGGAPDVATFKLSAAPMFVNNDLFADLTPFVDKWDEKDDIADNIYQVMKNAGGSDDSLYLMPWNTQILYIYYRPSVFKEAGITQTPETYDEFIEDIKKCTMDTDGDGKTDIYGFGMRGGAGGQEPWGDFIYGQGGSFDDLTSKESVKGMQDFIDLYQGGYVPKSATSDGFQETLANFQSGLTAMFVHHVGSSKGLIEALGDDVDAFMVPKGKGQWTSMGDTETVMFESCENKEAAFEWMKYLAANEGQKMWCEGTGQVPVDQKVQKDDYFQNDKFMKVSMEGIDFAGTVPVKDTTTEWISNWPAIISQALTGEITAEECMKQLDAALNK
ncbi:sugar ABC transporter substrate-binding protein [Blautia liquoris]|uniref:Sugar ABC transporter substrate-binding protein n=1 Tax=Blautia liquoris TaxID=2779518 RepID=A0A7M2RDX1_9FIRM|nr:sugar ABC transporter substrate-binding protein [Blautia liquoris]QOV18515.1 sugar ABC transporter substrate-binding protein [Blautia liquoris]